MQTQTSNSLHNAIMEAGSKDRPPMLAPGNYIQCKSRIKRYIDTKPNRELIHYCLENPPYELECQHPEQSESVHNTYLIEQDAQNVLIESEDMNYDSEQIDQNDEDVDLAKERELLASLIEKLKCEIDETTNCNTLLETSNKVLVEKLKSEIADFKNKNKSLTEANNKLSEVNAHLYADYKKSKAELQRSNTIEYATEMELECAKVRGDLLSYKMEYERSSEKYTHIINGLNQTVSELKEKLSAHQDTISILKQQKDAQIKLYKTRKDKDIKKSLI
nr:hypothetical protein [Tanacetum cinerariifolium]